MTCRNMLVKSVITSQSIHHLTPLVRPRDSVTSMKKFSTSFFFLEEPTKFQEVNVKLVGILRTRLPHLGWGWTSWTWVNSLEPFASQITNHYDMSNLEHKMRSFTWGNASFSAAKFYKFIFAQVHCDQVIQLIWKSNCLPKLQVFLWLLFHDHLNNKNIMARKNWHLEDGPNCLLCEEGVNETRDRLFFECKFARSFGVIST